MRLRAGVWLVASAACAAVLVRVASLAYADLCRANAETAPWLFDVRPGLDLALGIVLAGGLIAGALGSTGWTRIAWCGGALALAIPAVLATTAPLALVGIALFAVGAEVHGAGKRLARSTIVLALLVAALRGSGTWPPSWTLDAIPYIFACFIALDVLGAFPALSPRLPVASIASAAGRAGAWISLAFFAAGVAVCATAFQVVVAMGSEVALEKLVGAACIVAGVAGIWRGRGRAVWIPIVVVLDIGVFTAIDIPFDLATPPLDSVALRGRALPGFAISLPDGSDRTSAYHEVGILELESNHRALDVSVRWGFRARPVSELEYPMVSSTLVNDTLVHTTIGRDGDARVAELAWSCSPDSWTLLRLSAVMRDVRASGPRAFASLASQIANSVQCFPRPVLGPRYALRFARAGFVAVGIGDRITRYDGPAESLTTAWAVDLRSDRAVHSALVQLGEFDTAAPARIAIIEADGDLRSYRELASNGRRVLVTVWQCREAVWAARYDGPAELSLEAALDVIRAAHCP